jgi:hypothetical protein
MGDGPCRATRPQQTAIGVANKLARTIWAVWHHDVDFQHNRPAPVAA